MSNVRNSFWQSKKGVKEVFTPKDILLITNKQEHATWYCR
jgi:hypothetical protein